MRGPYCIRDSCHIRFHAVDATKMGSYNRVLQGLARAIREPKETKGIHFGKEEVKISLFADEIVVYISDPRNPTRELLQLISAFSNVAGYKSTQKSQYPSYIQKIKGLRKKTEKQRLLQ